MSIDRAGLVAGSIRLASGISNRRTGGRRPGAVGVNDLDHAVFASAIVSMLESYCWTWMAAGGDDGLASVDEETVVQTLAEMWRRAMFNAAG